MLTDPTALLLARWQFAFTVSFHFLFPAFTIGLASFLAVLEGLWLLTRQGALPRPLPLLAEDFRGGFRDGRRLGHRDVLRVRHQLVGVLRQGRAGDRAADGLRGADGVLPRGRISRRHAVRDQQGRAGTAFRGDVAVALGTLVSAFWILAANSWMQTPAGYEIGANGQFLPGPSWLAIIFNPAALSPGPHGAGGLPHHRLGGRRGRRVASAARTAPIPRARKMFSMAMWMAVVVAPIQIFVGDMHGLNTLEHQPAKVHGDGGRITKATRMARRSILFGIPNQDEQRVDYAVEIPKLSLADPEARLDAPLPGLDTIPATISRRSAIVFWASASWSGSALRCSGSGCGACVARWRGKLYDWRWLHRAALGDGAGGLRRRARRLGHHRGRPPALHDLRPAAHRAISIRRWPRLRWRPRCSRSWWSISRSSASASGTCCG